MILVAALNRSGISVSYNPKTQRFYAGVDGCNLKPISTQQAREVLFGPDADVYLDWYVRKEEFAWVNETPVLIMET